MCRPAIRFGSAVSHAVPARFGLRRRVSQEDGASAVEYALLVSLIVAVCIAVLASLGIHVHDLFDSLHL